MDLTEPQLAALASGVPMEDVLKMVAQVDPSDSTDPVAKPVDFTPVVAAVDPAPVVAAVDTSIVTFLQGELSKSQASLIQVTAEKQVLEAQATEAKTSQDGLLAIARDSVRSMTVALGGQASAAAVFGPTELLAEHARLSTVFKDKFKIGGVAAVSTEQPEVKKYVPNPLFAAQAKNAPAQ